MGRTLSKTLMLTTGLLLGFSSCQKSEEEASTTTSKKLYVTSGICNSGQGITTYAAGTASRAVTKWSSSSGEQLGTFIDFNNATGFADTLPQQILDEGDSILLLTENATTETERKIYRIMKNDPGTFLTVVPNTSIVAGDPDHISRSFQIDADGMFIMSRSFAAEKFTPIGGIVPGSTGTIAHINPSAATGTCFNAAASATNYISDLALMDPMDGFNSGKVIVANVGTLITDNRLAAINPNGLTGGTVADCAGGVQISTVAHTLGPDIADTIPATITFTANGVNPTSMVYIKTPAPATTAGKLLVTYAPALNTGLNNNTTLNHAVVLWDVTEDSTSAVTINNPVVLYRNHTVVYAPSAIAYDESSNSVFVAVGPNIGTANQTTSNLGYNIEKFTIDLNTPSLTRVTDDNRPFIKGNSQTKCISSMTVAE